MNITLTSLEALILKATHESLSSPDSAAMEAFCAVMRDATEGPQFATQALASRIHSSNPQEALLALMMLDRCMRRCDASFHGEVGKFRFLNEMIKLVSPKYFADRTSPEVRTRVLQLLHAWSIEYPKESKFKVAYDMLKNQGVVKETPPPLPPEDIAAPPKPRVKNAIFEDEEKSKLLQKLLQSKKAEDLQHANRLIKTMVREEERRTEANSRRALEVGAALDSAGLLRDMLEHAAEASPDEEQLIHELHASCARLKPVLQRLATTETQHPQNTALDDILHASDVLDEVFEKYNAFISERKDRVKILKAQNQASDGGGTLLDFAGSNVNNKPAEYLKNDNEKKMDLDELGDIFSTDTANSNIAEPLKPVNLMHADDIDILGEKNTKTEGWNELDSLGEQLLKQSLPDSARRRLDGFNSKSKKIPMNALEKAPSLSEPPITTINKEAMLDLDFFTKKTSSLKTVSVKPTISNNDDIMVDISILDNDTLPKDSPVDNNLDSNKEINVSATSDTIKSNNATEDKEERTENIAKTNKCAKSNDVKPLTDINVTLESVKPSKLSPVAAFEEDDGVSVVLHFCKDMPRPDVNVIVISTTSKNSLPIEDYKFQAVVPKGCKVRLLQPSGTSLPAYNPFFPPPAITQVMLVARPASTSSITLKFVITYTCEDDTYSEMGEVEHLPLDDIK